MWPRFMANSGKRLYDLQELDWGIASRNQGLADVRARLNDNQALLLTRSKVEEAQQREGEIHSRQRDLEMQAASLTEKVTELEARLYGGSVTSPRELSGMQEEVRLLKNRQKQLDEGLLEIMVENEGAQKTLQELQHELAKMETEWEVEHQRLLQEQDRFSEELDSLNQRRESLTAILHPPDLSLYDSLLTSKQGHAVAKVERATCQGCRMTLPTKELQQVRISDHLVQCSSCGRILYVS